MNDLEQNLRQKIAIYKMNRENISPEDLAGKYKAAYQRLIKEIEALATEFFSDLTYGGIEMPTDKCKKAAERIKKRAEASGVKKQVSEAIFKRYSLDAAIDMAVEFRRSIISDLLEEGAWITCGHENADYL